MNSLPYLPLFPGDVLRHLRPVGLEVCGIFLKAICIMHDAEPYGYLNVNGVPVAGEAMLSRVFGADGALVQRSLDELVSFGVFQKSADSGALFFEDMMKRERVRRARAAGGHKSVEHPTVAARIKKQSAEQPKDKGKDTHVESLSPSKAPSLSVSVSKEISASADAPVTTGVREFLREFIPLYKKHRNGAAYLVNKKRDVPNITRLLKQYGHNHLVKMAELMLTTKAYDDDYISNSDRSVSILTTKANWLDGRLRAKEVRVETQVECKKCKLQPPIRDLGGLCQRCHLDSIPATRTAA